jgi:iron complex outermembrane receptor protein
MRSTSKATENYVNGLLSETKLLNSTCTDLSTPCGPLNPTYTVGTLNPDINPFGLNDATGLAALRSALILQPTRISKSTRDSVDGHVSGELMKLPAGPLSASFGFERRKEKFDDNPLPVLSSGDVIGGGGDQQPVNKDRTVSAVFAELSIPIIKNLEGLFQLRYDKYSDFGSTTNPKLGLRWQASPEVVVRASGGKGFRAPTLPDLYGAISQTNTGGSFNDPYYEARVGDCFTATGAPSANFNPAYCQAQLTVKQGGNPNLGPEKSTQWNFGLALQPNRDWSATIDFWSIKVKGQIAIADPDALLSDFISQFLVNPNIAYDASTAKLSTAGKAAINAGASGVGIVKNAATGNLDYVSAQYNNLGSINTRGVDVSVKGTLARTSYGEFRASWDLSYLTKEDQDGFNLVGGYSQFGPVKRVKHALSTDWDYGAWNTNVSYHWESSYKDIGDTRTVAPWEYFDLAVSYRGIKNLTLNAGIQNIFNNNPPYSRQNDYFQVGYDPTYADPRGRTYVLGLRYTFK